MRGLPELNIPLEAKTTTAGAPSPSVASIASGVDGTDEELSTRGTPESRSGAESPLTTTSDADGVYCVEYLHQASDRAQVKLRKTCHRCGNIRKNNIACNSCEQIFCKACSRKFEQSSPTGFKFDENSEGCPVCLKLCCCANPKGYECKSMIHCYRRCEVSRKASKKRAKANTHIEKKIPYNYQHKRSGGVVGTPSTGRMTPQVNPSAVLSLSTPASLLSLPPTSALMSIEMDDAQSPMMYNSLGYQYGRDVMEEDDAALRDAEVKLEPAAFIGLDILTRVANSNLLY